MEKINENTLSQRKGTISPEANALVLGENKRVASSKEAAERGGLEKKVSGLWIWISTDDTHQGRPDQNIKKGGQKEKDRGHQQHLRGGVGCWA